MVVVATVVVPQCAEVGATETEMALIEGMMTAKIMGVAVVDPIETVKVEEVGTTKKRTGASMIAVGVTETAVATGTGKGGLA